MKCEIEITGGKVVYDHDKWYAVIHGCAFSYRIGPIKKTEAEAIVKKYIKTEKSGVKIPLKQSVTIEL